MQKNGCEYGASRVKILTFINAQTEPVFAHDVAEACDVNEVTAEKQLAKLAAEGKIRLKRKGRFYFYEKNNGGVYGKRQQN